MKLKKIISQPLINIGKHLPEAVIANLKYKFPSKKMVVIGVTGTDGKSTTTNMIYQILKDAGEKVSVISSINAIINGKIYETGFHVTSPKSSDVQRFIKLAREEGCEYMVLEVTSHSLDQFRFWGINFDIGVITNITHEHLDYHKSFENYFNTKAKLIKKVKVAVLNEQVLSLMLQKNKDKKNWTDGKIVTAGFHNAADFNPKSFPLQIKLPGDFNLLNALVASAASFNLGIDKEIIKHSLQKFRAISGRMEQIPNKKKVNIIVDFAHTPNALEETLKYLKTQTKGKLISVFGGASERDLKKRPMMGAISARLANITILTDEDPRFENREKIIEEIAVGAYKEGAIDDKSLFKIPDRQKAIKFAIQIAKKGDTVGIFGKGHEKSINYQGMEKLWSDQMAVKKALYG